jgi:putative SOS response-associated peptidase YedK
MPAILPPSTFEMWLDCASVDAETAAAFLLPAPEELLEAYEVSTAVNRAANDGPELLMPVAASVAQEPTATPAKRSRKPKTDDRQTSLF